MAIVTLVLGGLLIVLGVVAFVATGSLHFTALIPAAFGLVLEALGALALKPTLRKHAMHAAAVVALLGLFGTARSLPKALTLIQGGAVERPQAVVAQSIMAILCLVFVLLCVRSFVLARMAMREAGSR